MSKTAVFLSLALESNQDEELFHQVCQEIGQIAGVSDITLSRVYTLLDRLHAACQLKTSLPPQSFVQFIENFEQKFQVTIELLTFGLFFSRKEGLDLPHPNIGKKLTYLLPLLDFVEELELPDPSLKTGVRRLHLQTAVDQCLKAGVEMLTLKECETLVSVGGENEKCPG